MKAGPVKGDRPLTVAKGTPAKARRRLKRIVSTKRRH